VEEQVRRVVCKSSGRCTMVVCGRTMVRRVVVGWARLQRGRVRSGAACHELVRDTIADGRSYDTWDGLAEA
jgi:hypothetical protein